MEEFSKRRAADGETGLVSLHDMAVLRSIHTAPRAVSQRDLSQYAKLALGTINSTLKRLIENGLVVTKAVNGRVVRYSLTGRGHKLLQQDDYATIVRAVEVYGGYLDTLQAVVEKFITQGVHAFHIRGRGPLRRCVEHALAGVRDTLDARQEAVTEPSRVVVFCVDGQSAPAHVGEKVVDVVQVLKGGEYV